jgi:hypothetical protein
MKRVYVAMAALVFLGGCKSEKGSVESPQTSIVQKVKDGGFKEPELSQAFVADLQIWLMQHGDVAKSIAAQCKAAMKSDSVWQHSEEGRICLAEKGTLNGGA